MTMVWVANMAGSPDGKGFSLRPDPFERAGPSAAGVDGSTGVDGDVDGDAVGQHVVHGGPAAGLLDDRGELLGPRRVNEARSCL